ncbi:MAG: hypothetical protein QW035_00150 [Candidatus Anstonellales archaeon]
MITTAKSPGKQEISLAKKLSSFLCLPYVRRGRKGMVRLNEIANSIFQEYIGVVEKGGVLTIFRAGPKEPRYIASLKITSISSSQCPALDPLALESPSFKKGRLSIIMLVGKSKKGELKYEPLH